MGELIDSMDSMKLVPVTGSTVDEQGDTISLEPVQGTSVEEPISKNLSYLGRHLPYLIAKHPDWTIPQYYEHLSTKDDFPCDGSVTRKALRQKVSKLRKKMQANGGYLVDPMDNTQLLRSSEKSSNSSSIENSLAGSSKEVGRSSIKHTEESIESILSTVDVLGGMWVGFTLQGILKEKGPKEGIPKI